MTERVAAGHLTSCALSLSLLLAATLFCARSSRADDDPNVNAQAAALDDYTEDAAEADGDEPRRKLIHWNEYEGPYFSARLGGGLLFDGVAYSQDRDSKEQMRLLPEIKLRDFRFLLKGKIKRVPRLSYKIGYMYDAAEGSWRFRQTGLMIEIPELWGRLFIGRTKEGISMTRSWSAIRAGPWSAPPRTTRSCRSSPTA
jgi:hypothetical protein